MPVIKCTAMRSTPVQLFFEEFLLLLSSICFCHTSCTSNILNSVAHDGELNLR